jgi:Fe-Mn family superoxide dismutase
MPHSVQPLPYDLAALEPHISRETLEFHHGKHYAGYVAKLNAAIEGKDEDRLSLLELVRQGPSTAYFNNAAQAWNHEFYFNAFSAKAAGEPSGDLARAIESKFGDFARFRDAFNAQATGLFGSGWTWLVLDAKGELAIVNTGNAGNPVNDGMTPLMTCDVWEHAYYIDYRNLRPDYLKGFWEVLDWSVVAQRYAAAK